MDSAQQVNVPGSLILLEASVEGACLIVIGSKISGVVILIMHIMNFAGQVNIGVVGVPPGVNLIIGKDGEIFRFKMPQIIRISGGTGHMIAAMLPQIFQKITTYKASYSCN